MNNGKHYSNDFHLKLFLAFLLSCGIILFMEDQNMENNEFGEKFQGNDKLFGILAYIFILWIIGLVVEPEKNHAFVKNHVNNGILLTIAGVIVSIISKIPFIGLIIGLILGFSSGRVGRVSPSSYNWIAR